MKFGDFTDFTFLTFFICVVMILVVAIIMTVLFVLAHKKDRTVSDQIEFEKSTVRISVIDVQNNRITWFNKSNMKKKKTSDLMYFYNGFHANDVDKVKNWIFSIYMGEEVDEYIEADIYLQKGKKPCFSLLKLIKFNRENGLIHLESHLLKYITPKNSPLLKNRKKRVPTGVVKKSEVSLLIHKNKSLRGYSFGIRFFYLKQQALSNNRIEHHMLMTLKNEVYPFASNPKLGRQIIDDGDNELFLFDIRMTDRKSALQLANSMNHSIRKQIEVNGFAGYISFSIGIVENAQYYQDFDTIIECCKEACIRGQTNEQNIVLNLRDINNRNNIQKYENEVYRLFEKDVLRFLFRPILDVRDGKVVGYFEYVRAYDSPFTSYSEMTKYAVRINKNLDLFATICKHIIPKFVAENQNKKASLFLNVSLFDIKDVVSIIQQIPSSAKASFVFILDEQEVNENAGDYLVLENTLRTIKFEGYQIALMLKDKDLLLDNTIYGLFDHFIVGTSMLSEIRRNNRIRLSAYSLIESLLKYNKPIIATDLESWQGVELIIESGITYISTDVISPSNDMILPIEKKKLDKVIQMTDKYL